MYVHLDEYLRPADIAACLEALATPDTRSALLAGGTFLNAVGGGHESLQRVIDLQALPLDGVTANGAGLTLGARVTLARLLDDAVPAALRQAALAERNVAIRNASTVGGRICRDRANGRLATALLALGARVEVHTLDGAEEVELEALLKPTWRKGHARGFVVASVRIPTGGASGYADFCVTAVDSPYADAALAVDGGGAVRLASGGHAADAGGVLRLAQTEAWLAEHGDDPAGPDFEAAVKAAAGAELPAYTDARVGGEYRRDVAATLVARLVTAWKEGRR